MFTDGPKLAANIKEQYKVQWPSPGAAWTMKVFDLLRYIRHGLIFCEGQPLPVVSNNKLQNTALKQQIIPPVVFWK